MFPKFVLERSSGVEKESRGILNIGSDSSIITPDALRLSTIDSIDPIGEGNGVEGVTTEIVDTVAGGGVIASTGLGVICTTVTNVVGDNGGVDT